MNFQKGQLYRLQYAFSTIVAECLGIRGYVDTIYEGSFFSFRPLTGIESMILNYT